MTVNSGFGITFDFEAFIAAVVMVVLWAVITALAE